MDFLFISVVNHFRHWVNEKEDYIVCCWGFDDIKELISNCKYYGFYPSFAKPWFNIQSHYMEKFNLNDKPGLKSVVEKI